MMDNDEAIAAAGEIDAAMGRALWTIGQRTAAKDLQAVLIEVVASVSRVLGEDDAAVLPAFAGAVTAEQMRRMPTVGGVQ